MKKALPLGLAICFLLALVPASGQDAPHTRSLGTRYLPLDHWAYPVLERAIAIGAIPDQFLGQRPWTRIAIAKLLAERRVHPSKFANDGESASMVLRLEKEFAPEMRILDGDRVKNAEIENVYGRLTGISGDESLRDSFHVGQTVVNDFGRPYGNGANGVAGGTGHAEYGFLGIELQGEYQHGATPLVYSPGQLTTLAIHDLLPYPVLPRQKQVDQAVLMDSYVSATWKRLYFSFGKESQWWGPGESSAMLYSDNAAPMYMFKIDLAQPITLPWILKYLGPMRLQLFNGKTSGHYHPAEAYLHGEKVSFMPTKNLELGFSRTTVWAGVGHPITWSSVGRTYFSVGDNQNADKPKQDPGDRRGGFDVRYKVPGLRNWLTVYTDSFVDDDPSPLNAPNRAAFHPGMYLSHVPGISKLDFRAEGAYTQLPTEPNDNGHFFYDNTSYRDGYTMKGLLIGDWVGREGKGGQLSSTYWLAPDRTVQVYWRNHMIAPDFIPGGAHQNDFGANISYAIGAHLTAAGTLQYEKYNIPLIVDRPQSDVTASVTLTYWPRKSQESK
jgi:hypothetical protein